MKNLFFASLTFFIFSCTPKTTLEQNDAYNACKKTIVENKDFFLSKSISESGRDSVQDYYDKIEKNNLDELISDLAMEQEQVNILIYSVCAQAEKLKSIAFIKKELLRTDSLLQDIESKE